MTGNWSLGTGDPLRSIFEDEDEDEDDDEDETMHGFVQSAFVLVLDLR